MHVYLCHFLSCLAVEGCADPGERGIWGVVHQTKRYVTGRGPTRRGGGGGGSGGFKLLNLPLRTFWTVSSVEHEVRNFSANRLSQSYNNILTL